MQGNPLIETGLAVQTSGATSVGQFWVEISPGSGSVLGGRQQLSTDRHRLLEQIEYVPPAEAEAHYRRLPAENKKRAATT